MNDINDNSGIEYVRENDITVGIKYNGKVFSKYDLLALACDIGSDDIDISWKVMNLVSRIFHPQNDPTFNTLYGAAAMHITWESSSVKKEFHLHGMFKRAASILLGKEYKCVEKKNDARNWPDAWVVRDGIEIPVEMKNKNFDSRALSQLKRYMKAYGCNEGIAIGSMLTTPIPNNVTFIARSQIEEALCK